jgi:hypothetical protein
MGWPPFCLKPLFRLFWPFRPFLPVAFLECFATLLAVRELGRADDFVRAAVLEPGDAHNVDAALRLFLGL